MTEHAHTWAFTFTAAGWSAACACGLAVAVEEQPAGRTLWEWNLHGAPPPAELMLAGVGSVTRAHRDVLAARERAN